MFVNYTASMGVTVNAFRRPECTGSDDVYDLLESIEKGGPSIVVSFEVANEAWGIDHPSVGEVISALQNINES